MNRKQKLIKLAELTEKKKKLDVEIKELKKDLEITEPVYIKFVNKIIKMATVKSERATFDSKKFKVDHPKLYSQYIKKQEVVKTDIREVKTIKNDFELITSKASI